jgi:hypothetical protein
MKRLLAAGVLCVPLFACAARQAAPPSASPAGAAAQDATPGATGGSAAGQPGYPQQQPKPYATPPPPPPAPTAVAPTTPSTSTGRAVAIQQASSDVESAQRELDVAGSSCQNACRALGSMDRAAGHLCQLTREDTTQDKCEDAKRRLYSARDRVRNTCGSCPDNQPSVDRNAPVPSMR